MKHDDDTHIERHSGAESELAAEIAAIRQDILDAADVHAVLEAMQRANIGVVAAEHFKPTVQISRAANDAVQAIVNATDIAYEKLASEPESKDAYGAQAAELRDKSRTQPDQNTPSGSDSEEYARILVEAAFDEIFSQNPDLRTNLEDADDLVGI